MNRELGARLHQLGFYPAGFSAALYGAPDRIAAEPAEEVGVQEVAPEAIDLFLDLYQDGFGLDRLDRDEKRVVRAWYDNAEENLRFYIARVNGVPAAIGVLFLTGDVGLLADAATLPDYRGQGCQTRLIQHRVQQANESGCTMLASFVEFGSASHRNLERSGFRIAYTKALWVTGDKVG